MPERVPSSDITAKPLMPRESTSSPVFRRCVFVRNEATLFAGGLQGLFCDDLVLEDCTFFENRARYAACVDSWDSTVRIVRSILAFSRGGRSTLCEGSGTFVLTCTDIFGGEAVEWSGCVAEQLGEEGNFSADPLFCDPENFDFTLSAGSPCLPGHHPDGADCGTIGAFGEGCVSTSVPAGRSEPISWGRVKSLFR